MEDECTETIFLAIHVAFSLFDDLIIKTRLSDRLIGV